MEKDHIIRLAIDRLSILRAESSELEAFLATYQKLAAGIPQVCAVTTQLQRPPQAPPQDKTWSTDRILLEAGNALNANKGPMRLSVLFAELIRRGAIIGGKVPVNNLGAKLSADPRFETSEHGWWYRGEHLPLGYLENFEDLENEKGPEAFDPEPSHMNGATEDHTARNGH